MLHPDQTFNPPEYLLYRTTPEYIQMRISQYEGMRPKILSDYCCAHEHDSPEAFYNLGQEYIANWVLNKRLTSIFDTLTFYAKQLSPHVQKILAIYVQEISNKTETGSNITQQISHPILKAIFEPAQPGPSHTPETLPHAIDDFLGFYNQPQRLPADSKRRLKAFVGKLIEPNPSRSIPCANTK